MGVRRRSDRTECLVFLVRSKWIIPKTEKERSSSRSILFTNMQIDIRRNQLKY